MDTPSSGSRSWRPWYCTVASLALFMLVTSAVPRAQERVEPAANRPPDQAAPAAPDEGDAGNPIARGIEFAVRTFSSATGSGEATNGFYPEFSHMVTGAGWISAGPGYRHWLWQDRAFFDASAAISWRSFKMARVQFEMPRIARSRVTPGVQLRWQDFTQLTYFGTGPDAAEIDRSEYRLQSTDAVGYVSVRPAQWFSVSGHVGWLASPSVDSPDGTFRRDYPDARETFPLDPVYQRDQQPGYAHGGLSVLADTRDHHGYPTQGTVYRAAWTKYVDRENNAFTFDRYEMEAAQLVPLAGRRLILALHGWVVGSDTVEDRLVPFYLQPSLGGANTLRAYASYRFHDRNLLLASAEARVPIGYYLDAAAFVDAGNVAARFGDLNLDRRSFGAGLRLHSRRSTLARFDLAHGAEGWRFLLRLSDPLRLGRLSERTAAIPFVP